MKLLAVDTAADACSVGAVDGDAWVLRSEALKRGHAERLMGMIAEAMAAAGLGFADLDRLAVTIGPGSFTGIRVGIAAVRGLALVHRTPMVGMTTLAVHAEAARARVGPVPVLAAIAAGRGEAYGQVFGDEGAAIDEPIIASPQAVAALHEKGMAIAGSGADLIVAALPMDRRPLVAHRDAVPDISAVCRLGLAALADGAPPRPLYVRPPDARPQTGARIARR
jgi:tRNA threonylcarbamoyl adenosine modification protein YeaZ